MSSDTLPVNMTSTEPSIPFIPTSKRQLPPTQFKCKEEGKDVNLWYITEDEYFRLNKIFGRDFQETGLGGTLVVGLPSPCTGCGKYTEFVDWVWTAIRRGVHSKEFIFKALTDGRQGDETVHDVYCSECGKLTSARRADDAEGSAPDISLASRMKRSDYPTMSAEARKEKMANARKSSSVRWGKWWLDDKGSTAAYRESLKQSAAQAQADGK